MAHLKIVENHAFSREGEGAQNSLCRKVGPFVEACVGGNWGQFKTKKYTSIFTFNTPPHIATAVKSFGEGDSDRDRGETKSTPSLSTGV